MCLISLHKTMYYGFTNNLTNFIAYKIKRSKTFQYSYNNSYICEANTYAVPKIRS